MKVGVLSRKADYIGITGSVLCIIHCLVTPILLVSTSLLDNNALRFGYLSLDYVFIGVNIIAVYFATRHHSSSVIKLALWGFLALFSVAIILEEVNELFEYVGYFASAGLIVTHLTNLRYCRMHHAH